MDEDELIAVMREHFAGLFPRDCPSCGHSYGTLRQYVLETARIPGPISYDAELGEWSPNKPFGGLALANCACGGTLALSTEGIPLDKIHGILRWMKVESERTGMTPTQLLEGIRDKVRAWAVGSER